MKLDSSRILNFVNFCLFYLQNFLGYLTIAWLFYETWILIVSGIPVDTWKDLADWWATLASFWPSSINSHTLYSSLSFLFRQISSSEDQLWKSTFLRLSLSLNARGPSTAFIRELGGRSQPVESQQPDGEGGSEVWNLARWPSELLSLEPR